MIVKVKNYNSFVKDIIDYIKEYHNIIPTNLTNYQEEYSKPVIYYKTLGLLENYECPIEELHVHNNQFVFCSEPERIAIKFILHSIYGKYRSTLIESLREWLPFATFENVSVKLSKNTKTSIYSSLYPGYLYSLLNKKYTTRSTTKLIKINYTYIDLIGYSKNLFYKQLPEFEILDSDFIKKHFLCVVDQEIQLGNFKIMARKRQVARRASTSGGRKRRRSRSKSPSRSRSRSVSPRRRVGVRRRSRSRSPSTQAGRRRSRSSSR